MSIYKVEVSSKTIIFSVFFILLLIFVWMIRDLLYSLVIAFILMSALRPAVMFLERYHFPRRFAAILVYTIFIAVFIFLVSLIIPPIITESGNLIKNFPYIMKQLNPKLESSALLSNLDKYLPTITGSIVSFAGSIFSNTLFVISTLFFGFYFLMEENILKNFIIQFVDKKKAEQIVSIFNRAEKRMNSWFWGELSLMVVIGCATYIGLTLLGIRYALSLAVLAGLLEVVPNIGPIMSAVPAALIGFSQGSFLGFASIGLYVVIQQLENNLIVPYVMKQAVGLNPVVTLVALIIGGRLGGVIGVLLAIPIFLFIETIIIELTRDEKLTESLP